VNSQIVYLLHFQTEYYTSILSVIRGFTYIFYNFYYFIVSESNLDLGNSARYLGYSSSNWLVSMGVLAVLLNAIIILYGLISLIQRMSGHNSKHHISSCFSRFLSKLKYVLYQILLVLSVSSALFLFLQSV